MSSPLLFNRDVYRKRRNRVARAYPNHDFLKREACKRIADRLADMTRSFPLALDLGCHTGQMQEELKEAGGIHRLIQCDSAETMVREVPQAMSFPRRRESSPEDTQEDSRLRGNDSLVCDEELLPFGENSFDAVFAALSLHHVNDLVGCLIQIQKILKPDGLFLAIFPGPQTLTELRESLTVADIATSGGLSPYISPFMDVRDAGNLLQRAGFALPVIDNDTLTITYPDPHALMMELRGMGETNCLNEQRKGLMPPETLASMALHYMSEYADDEQRIRATVELVTLTAWKPDQNQQQPAKRGSGQINLGDFLSPPNA